VTTKKNSDLIGIVLMGGKSQRMGKDKSLISYHGIPQYQYLHQLLSYFCEEVYLSNNASQTSNLDSNYQFITDLNNDCGPLEGIRSAFEQVNKALLVVPCDMPNINSDTINALIHARDSNYDAVCFQDDKGFINPLLSIWELSCKHKLDIYKGASAKQFLETANTKTLKGDINSLQNINTTDEFNDFLKHQG
jgi:molybdopterin-guanine dinucleotide biosynthesis protein A